MSAASKTGKQDENDCTVEVIHADKDAQESEGEALNEQQADEEANADESSADKSSGNEPSGDKPQASESSDEEASDTEPDPEEPAPEEPSAEDLVAAAQAEANEWQDKFLRLHAEWDTYRRRTSEQRTEEKKRATEKLVTNLLPLLDDFERSISFATENGEAELLDGVKAVHAKFLDVLAKEGVEAIDPAGEPYNALEAQAVGTVENADVCEETVAEVYQKGYRMASKVLRPAMVTVTTGGPAREKEAEVEEEDK